MKTEQQQQAQHLYFQTDLSKSQIAETLGVSRRSLHYWIRQNDWERIKTSGQHIPSFLAENYYALIGGLMDEILLETIADHVRSGIKSLFVAGYATGALPVGYRPVEVPGARPTIMMMMMVKKVRL